MKIKGQPIFTEGMGGWINPDRLAPEALSRLRLYLPASMTGEERSTFLRLTSEAVDFWEQCKSANPLSQAELVERIEKVELAAKAMQRAIENLQGDHFDVMEPHFSYLIYGTSPPFKLPDELRTRKAKLGGVLAGAWTTCQTLRDAGAHARTQIRVDRSIKPSMQSARSLAYQVATAYQGIFGERPPTNKGAWFIGYMADLGDILQIDAKFGYSMLTAVASKLHTV
jgi:hypothetical protein